MKQRINEKTLLQFASNFAESLEHNEFALDAMTRIAQSINDPYLCDVIFTVVYDCRENGLSLSKAMAARDGAFSDEFLQAFKAGERNGSLVKSLQIFLKYRKLNDVLNKHLGLDEN